MSKNPDPKSVFVVSVIGTPGTDAHRKSLLALNYIIKKALPEPEWMVRRADFETSPDSITSAVIRRIFEADLVIADLTDHNPNVFYELAVAHGYGKSTIHLLEDGQSMSFDVADQRAIFYDLTDPESVHNAIASVAASAKSLEDAASPQQNPLSMLGQFKIIESTSGVDDGGKEVAIALERVSDRLGVAERLLRTRPIPTHGLRESGILSPPLTRAELRAAYDSSLFKSLADGVEGIEPSS